MEEIIPILNCKWNDVVQFSALDPQLIVDKLKTIQDDFKLFRTEYFKIHVSRILNVYDAVTFDRDLEREKGNFTIKESEVKKLSLGYKVMSEVPGETIRFWNNAKIEGGKYLWFPFVTHILVKGVIDTKDFEVVS